MQSNEQLQARIESLRADIRDGCDLKLASECVDRIEEVITLREREELLYRFAALYALGYFSALPPFEFSAVRELGEKSCDTLSNVGKFCEKLGAMIAAITKEKGVPK